MLERKLTYLAITTAFSLSLPTSRTPTYQPENPIQINQNELENTHRPLSYMLLWKKLRICEKSLHRRDYA